jgi:hypothetical protein
LSGGAASSGSDASGGAVAGFCSRNACWIYTPRLPSGLPPPDEASGSIPIDGRPGTRGAPAARERSVVTASPPGACDPYTKTPSAANDGPPCVPQIALGAVRHIPHSGPFAR